MSCCSKKQLTASRSSTDFEYQTLASVTAEVMWLESFLNELQIHINKKAIIWCDNLSAVLLSANPILHTRKKHMKLDLYVIPEQINSGKININHISASYQRGDILMKVLSTRNFCRFRDDLKIRSLNGKSENDNSSSN